MRTLMVQENKLINRRRHGTGPESYVLWFLFPFLSLIQAITHYKESWAQNILWLFIIFYGFTFVISNDQLDASRYSKALVHAHQQEATSVADFISLLYNEETNYVDIVQPLITFLVSRFTADARILFAIFGFIFGYFYSRNVAFVLSFVNERVKKEAIPYLLLFIFIVSIWQINGFRFATATHVFIFGLFKFAHGNRTKGILFCLGSVFVHFSFVLPLGILLIHLVIGNQMVFTFIIFFASFFISQVTPEAVRGFSEYVPEVFRERSDRYTSDLYLKARAQQAMKAANWYVGWRMLTLLYLTNIILVFVIVRFRKLFQRDRLMLTLLCFSLLLFAVSNILSSLPSLGVRFQMVALVILFASLFLFVQKYFRQVLFPVPIRFALLLTMLLYVIVEIRIGFDTMGIMTVIGNPFIAPFVENNFPLINLLK
jgi:hypothetical protein